MDTKLLITLNDDEREMALDWAKKIMRALAEQNTIGNAAAVRNSG
jgi:hypothetical protein